MSLADKSLGFQTSFLTHFPLPRTNVGTTFTREVNGIRCTYFDALGIPYTAVDRRWIEIVTTLARRQSPVARVEFGAVSQTLKRYGMARESNYILPARKALEKLARLHISTTRVAKGGGLVAHQGLDFSLSRKHQILWAHGRTDLVEPELFDQENYMELSPDFMAFVQNAAPHNQDHYMTIRSPLTLDVYHWLVTKLYDLSDEMLLEWPKLYSQFGQGGRLNDSQMKNMRRLLKASLLDIVKNYYPRARVKAIDEGIVLMKSPPLIEPDNKKAGYSLI